MRRTRLTFLLGPLLLAAAGCASHDDVDYADGPAGYYDGGAYYESPRPVDVDVEQRYYYRPYYGPYGYPGYYGGYGGGVHGRYRDHPDRGDDGRRGDGRRDDGGRDDVGRERVRGDRSPVPPPGGAGRDASPGPGRAPPAAPQGAAGAGRSGGGPHGRH